MGSGAISSILISRSGFVLPLLLPVLVIFGNTAGGAWNFSTALFIFLCVPLLDLLLPSDTGTALPRSATTKGWRRYFSGFLYAWIPIELSLLLWTGSAVPSTTGVTSRAGLIVSTGAVTGTIGIFVAHELGHRSGRFDRGLAYALLCAIGYTHFLIEHNEGHHIRVATPDDPATASLGQSFWSYLPRAVWGGFQDALQIERSRLAAAGQAAMSPRNRVLWGAGVQALLWTAIVTGAGWQALGVIIGQGALAVVIVELGNYVEHYGLVRDSTADGRYEPVSVRHSWNANHRLTNWLSFNLQRHSNHHCRVLRHYEALEHIETAPALPASYPAMGVLALIPPLWRHIMDPLAERARVDLGNRMGSGRHTSRAQ